MNDDELRARLRRLDPQATAPVDPITSQRAQNLLERTMTAITAPQRYRQALAAAAAVAAVAIAVGVLASRDDNRSAVPANKTTLALSLPDPNSLTSCVPFDVAVLKGFPFAFAGKATSVKGDTVTLDVTKWYVGGTAQVVTLSTPGANTSVSLDSTKFAKGKDYLVSANDGMVIGCGYTGEASDRLQQAYAQAFGG